MKKSIRNFLLLLSSLLVLSACSAKGEAQLVMDKKIKTGSLENGMHYYVMQNKEPENRIMLRLVVNAGSNMEDEDQRGLAHLVEHMAFNGSENFEANALIHYFESIGMNFGPDVNAYTSWDETVYMLEVPADDEEMLKTGMLVLRDWACALSFNQNELDRERGVVTEEWRLGRGLSGRIQDTMVPLLFNGSRYAERLPIGLMDVVQNVSRERVVDFYEKWYRPEFMSVVLVGDADVKVLENAVISAMSEIPSSDGSVSLPQYELPTHSEKNTLVFRDEEQPYSMIQFCALSDNAPVLTGEQFRASIVKDIMLSAFNERLSDITVSAESPWLDAAAFTDSYSVKISFDSLAFIPKEGQFEEALFSFLDEYDRYKAYGIRQSELERAKKTVLASAEQVYKNRNHISSASLASQIVQQILSGEPDLSYEDYYALVKKYVKTITLNDVNNAISSWLSDRGNLLLAISPLESDVPGEEELLKLWTEYKSEVPLESLEEENFESEIYARPKSKASVKNKKNISSLGATVYTLSNGVKLIFKKTAFEKDQFSFSAVSAGGLSRVEDEDYPSASVCSTYASYSGLNGISYNNLTRMLSDKNVSLRFGLDGYVDYFSGMSSKTDAELMMQLVAAYFTSPYFSENGWTYVKNVYETQASMHGVEPDDDFYDEILRLLYGNDIRHSSLTPEYVSKFDSAKAEEIFREHFKDPSDFTFVFVGDFDQKKLLDLCRTYLGTLPVYEGKSSEVWREPSFPQGIKTSVVRRGLEEQASVFIGFGVELSPAKDSAELWQDMELVDELQYLLEIKLRESLREDKGGTYGVGVSANISQLHSVGSRRKVDVQVSFECEPSRVDELVEETFNTLWTLQNSPTDEETLVKLRENYKRSKELSVKSNSWWVGELLWSLGYEIQSVEAVKDTESIPALITGENMQALVQKYCPLDNYVSVVLLPEVR